jgi:hypothetical protein
MRRSKKRVGIFQTIVGFIAVVCIILICFQIGLSAFGLETNKHDLKGIVEHVWNEYNKPVPTVKLPFKLPKELGPMPKNVRYKDLARLVFFIFSKNGF